MRPERRGKYYHLFISVSMQCDSQLQAKVITIIVAPTHEIKKKNHIAGIPILCE